MKNNKENHNIYEAFYSSKIKRITIPIPGFKKYNRTITEEGDDEYIEREPIMSQLLDWLKEEHNFTGACLVTGYRGMGKSSFVGKVLSKITSEKRQWKHAPFFLKFLWLVVSIIFYTYNFSIASINQIPWYTWVLSIGILAATIRVLFYILKSNPKKGKFIYHAIKINVGREVYNEKDILFLLTKNVYQQFLDYYRNTSSHLLTSLVAFFIKWCILCIIIINWEVFQNLIKCINKTSIDWISCIHHEIPLLGYTIYFIGGYALLSIIEKIILTLLNRHTSIHTWSLYVVKKKLENLNERIDATINKEVSANKWGVGFSKRKQYEVASIREIELELIQVFDLIDKIGGIPYLFPKVRFIFVLDELDKAETSQKENKKENISEVIPTYNPSNRGFNGESARVRKENLLHTLAGMKYFLSTVKAKFIFVAGQELYDAYLADLSDREFSISSVFNQVISVRSFLKAGSGDDDIYTMSERFVCKRLMTRNERSTNLKQDEKKESLAHYYRIQKQKFPTTTEEEESDEELHLELQWELDRKIHFLYHFVFYLMHISNGSPKKMTLNFETFVRSADFCVQKGYLNQDEVEAEYYLTFGDSSISKINFVHYLAYPAVQSLLNKSQIYTDKQMISTSFMINHIYKYHNLGFSWRNLEHIPELLDINKTPELRDFIGSIVTFLCQVHLEWVSCGLYLFKFPLRIAEEISFASNKSEELSALFNFSRDESLPIKEHYISLLKYYSEQSNTGCQTSNPSLASIHHTLGDIYLADEDYTQAIFEYQTALQLLKEQVHLLKEQVKQARYDNDGHWVSHMIFYMRNMLKLGLAFEKRKTYNSAYATYGELIHKLVDFRFLDEKELGLVYEKKETEGQTNEEEIAYLHKPQWSFSVYEDKRHKIWETRLWDDSYKGRSFKSNQLRSEFSSIVSPQLKAILSRLSSFEDVRFVYLGTLARLAVIEKMQMGGITQTDLQIAIDEFKYFHITADPKVRPIIAIDFYKKLAEILYYKMGMFSDKNNTFAFALYIQGYDLKKYLEEKLIKGCLEDNDNYLKTKKNIETIIQEKDYTKINAHIPNISEHIINHSSVCQKRRNKAIECGHSLPCLSCKFYNISLHRILTDIFNEKMDINETKINTIIHILKDKKQTIHILGEQEQIAIGSTLEGLGNVYLSCAGMKSNDKTSNISTKFGSSFESMFKKTTDEELNFNNLSHIEKSILYFWFASVFYETAGKLTASFRCYKRILEILLMYIHIDKKDIKCIYNTSLKKINRHLTEKALSKIYEHYEYINIAEIQTLKSIYDMEVYKDLPLNKLSLFPDIEEFLHISYSIDLTNEKDKVKFDLIKKHYNSAQTGRFKQISTLSQNISNLRFKALLNKELLGLLGFNKNVDSLLFDERNGLIDFYKWFNRFFKEENPNDWDIDQFMHTQTAVDDEDFKKKEILEFLIADSMFCLSKCITLITPIKNSTLFTNSFIAQLYRDLFFWNQLFESVYNIYLGAKQDETEVLQAIISKSQRHVGYSKDEKESNEKLRNELFSQYKDCVNTVLTLTVNEEELAENFMERIKRAIGEDYHKHLISNYIAGNALKYYKRALEIHTEGNEYKDMISNLHFLDDDLNNDTCQFYLAIERYKINSGHISELIDAFEHLQDESSIYNPKKYYNY